MLNLLKQGFKNVVGMNGTDIPPSIADLCKQKTVTLFVDGDRGGDLIIKELSEIAEIDYVAKAPDGKETTVGPGARRQRRLLSGGQRCDPAPPGR